MSEKPKLEGFPGQFKQNLRDADHQIENPEEHIETIKRMIEGAGITEGSRIRVATKDHPSGIIGIMRSMQLEESEPGFSADAAPMKNVRFDLKNIILIEKEEIPQ